MSFSNFITKPLLTLSINLDQNKEDFISVLIPARNEENNISIILDSLILEDYQNLEIIILNDNSTDNTEKILKEYSLKNSKIKYINGLELPEGWLGKNWACNQLSKEAIKNSNSKYLLFLDADTIIEKGLINSSIKYLKSNKLKLLSIFPDQIMISLGEKLTVPLMHNILLALLPLFLIKNTKYSSLSAANGQFMLFDSENYKANNWHNIVKDQITEDIKIIRLMKTKSYKCMTLLGNNLIKCQMYKNLDEGINGFSKNIILMLGGSIIFMLIYLFLMSWVWIYLLFTVSFQKIIYLILIVIFQRTLISKISNQGIVLNILLYPFQLIILNYIAFIAIYKKYTGNLTWKGRNI